jgi:GAF domain-containing protein
VVPDVHAFPGHISCDLASNSEIVIPFYAGDRLLGVLDIDSPKLARFDETDATYLTRFLETLVEKTDFPG